MFFIDFIFCPRVIPTMVVMIAKMQVMDKARRGEIVIGRLITFIVLSLGLEAKFATLDPIEDGSPLDLNSCMAQKFIKVKSQNEYNLMIRNQVSMSVVFPNWPWTDVWDEGNLLYPLYAPTCTDVYDATDTCANIW